jgi:hypothetical protein
MTRTMKLHRSEARFLARELYPALKAAGLPARGVPQPAAHRLHNPRVEQHPARHRILGHSSFATTMKLYGGLTSEALEKCCGYCWGSVRAEAGQKPDKRVSASRGM